MPDYPFDAETNINTKIQTDTGNEPIPKGHPITVHDEHNGLGIVSADIDGEIIVGGMYASDYDPITTDAADDTGANAESA